MNGTRKIICTLVCMLSLTSHAMNIPDYTEVNRIKRACVATLCTLGSGLVTTSCFVTTLGYSHNAYYACDPLGKIEDYDCIYYKQQNHIFGLLTLASAGFTVACAHVAWKRLHDLGQPAEDFE